MSLLKVSKSNYKGYVSRSPRELQPGYSYHVLEFKVKNSKFKMSDLPPQPITERSLNLLSAL